MICNKCGAEVIYFIEMDALYSGEPEFPLGQQCPKCYQWQDPNLEEGGDTG